MTNFVFDNPTKLLFGTGKLGELHKEKLPGKKALLLLSQTLDFGQEFFGILYVPVEGGMAFLRHDAVFFQALLCALLRNGEVIRTFGYVIACHVVQRHGHIGQVCIGVLLCQLAVVFQGLVVFFFGFVVLVGVVVEGTQVVQCLSHFGQVCIGVLLGQLAAYF